MKLYVDLNGNVAQIGRLNDANAQNVDGTSASAASTVIDAAADCIVRIVALAAVYLAFGATPTAASGDVYLPANGELWTEVAKGHKIACLGGVINITKVV